MAAFEGLRLNIAKSRWQTTMAHDVLATNYILMTLVLVNLAAAIKCSGLETKTVVAEHDGVRQEVTREKGVI